MKKFVIIIPFLFISPLFHDVPLDDDLAIIDKFFVPENITLEDDAFHVYPMHVETWYYECFFNNDYSMVFIVTVLSNGKIGLALTGLYIYRNGHLEYVGRVVTPSPFFSVSTEKPLIKISGKEIINGYIDETGNISYIISFKNDGYGIFLSFVNETRGWKGRMSKGWWLAVPKCKVRGNITIKNDVMEVEGEGYHDHNIFPLYTPLIERGYIDGKLLGNSFSIVWGKIYHNRWNNDTFAVISKNGKYISIPQEDISIKEKSFIYSHGRFIPTEVNFSFNISDVKGFLNMRAKDFHHIRLPFLWYWRYHVITTGRIRIGENEIMINEMEMMELMIY